MKLNNIVNNNSDVATSKHADTQEIQVTKGYKAKIFANHLVAYILYAIVLAVVVFIGFVTIKGPVLTTHGYIYPTEQPAKNGSNVIITRQEDNFAGRIANGSVKQNPIYGKVIVGNYGTLTETKDVYTVTQDSKIFKTSVPVQEKHGRYLNNEYIIKVTKGKNTGKEMLVKAANVRTLKNSDVK